MYVSSLPTLYCFFQYFKLYNIYLCNDQASCKKKKWEYTNLWNKDFYKKRQLQTYPILKQKCKKASAVKLLSFIKKRIYLANFVSTGIYDYQYLEA